MSYRGGVATGAGGMLLVSAAVAAGWWVLARPTAGTTKATPPAVPATVPRTFKEDQATSLTLTPDAEARLQITTAAVEKRSVARVRLYGGEVTVPPGRSVIVSAPLAGVLKPAADAVPAAGSQVSRGKAVFQLLPLLDPVGQANLTASKVDAQGQVENAKEQVHGAEIALDRAKKVLAGGAGSQRMVDDAQVIVDVAKKTLAAAEARRNLLEKVLGQVETGTTTAVPVEAPFDGVLRNISVQPGQTVPAGAVLFEVLDLGKVWVRVPVYVGDLPDIDAAAPAAIGALTAGPRETTRPANPVTAPPSALAAAGTADVFYALDNPEPRYNPGQRVGVNLRLKGPAEGLVVPAAAVVYDIHGGGWVYEKLPERSYARRRVSVRYVTGADAVLSTGPAPGTVLVAAGAAELFGTETGFSK